MTRAQADLQLRDVPATPQSCYRHTMDTPWDHHHDNRSESGLDLAAADGDDTAAREILASGMPIHVAKDDTPAGHVIRVHPGGREELILVDRDAAARILGL